MLAHAAAQGLPHAGRTQWYALSAAGMSLVCWDFTLYDNRVAVVSCAPPPVVSTV